MTDKKYNQYVSNENYITIGIKRIKTLSVAEARYLINLFLKLPHITSDLSTKTGV